MKHTNCGPDCGICKRIDYSRSRHAHADNVTCIEAGAAGHPPWAEPEDEDELAYWNNEQLWLDRP